MYRRVPDNVDNVSDVVDAAEKKNTLPTEGYQIHSFFLFLNLYLNLQQDVSTNHAPLPAPHPHVFELLESRGGLLV